MSKELEKKLKAPFSKDDIEWRIQQAGKSGESVWALVLAYVTNRAIMDRLDEVFGIEGWKNEYRPGPQGGVVCGISCRIGDEWLTKWDGAENTQVEPVKGGLSDSMKRAAVHWGVGRYLYNLESTFAEIAHGAERKGVCEDKKTKQKIRFRWNPPQLPDWALPESEKGKGGTSKEKMTDIPQVQDEAPNSPVETITKDQERAIESLMKEVKADKAGFLKFLGVKTVADIPVSRYSAAVKALEKKRAREKAGAKK